MSHHRKHKVKSHHWTSGVLEVRHYIAESLEDALEYVRNLFCHSAKIYDEDDNLVKECSGNDNNTYA